MIDIFALDGDGAYRVGAISMDNYENTSSDSLWFNIDNDVPSLDVTEPYTGQVMVGSFAFDIDSIDIFPIAPV